MTRCSDERALDRVAFQQGDLTSDPSHRCYCCDRQAGPFRSLTLSNKGWVCTIDDFCRRGTSEDRRTHKRIHDWEDKLRNDRRIT